MSKPDTWMPLYVAKYLADTTMFTAEQHGAYLLLLMAGWMEGGELPDDDVQLAMAARLTPAAWRKARTVIAPKFDIAGGVWRQKRQVEEIEKAQRLYASKVANGKLGGRPKKTDRITETGTEKKPRGLPKRKLDETQEQVQQTNTVGALDLTVPKNQSANADLSGGSPDASASDRKAETTRKLRADAVGILAFLNAKTGRQYEPVPANVDPIVSRLKEGFTAIRVRQVVAKKAREWAGDEKMDQYIRPKTLFSATNFANYAGEIVEVPDEEAAA